MVVNMTNGIIKKRDSNFELLRICLMLMIIGGHVMMNHKEPFILNSSDEIIKLFFRGAFCVAVNAFVLISGYFGIQFKKDRLIRLVIQTLFYSSVFMLLAVYMGWHRFSPIPDAYAFLPILTKQYWFVTCYVVLYVIAPWLNIWVENLEKDMYKRFLMVGFLIVYVWPTISFLFNTPQFIGDSGFGIVNFCYLYMLGRYLRIHYVDKSSSYYYLGGYLMSVVLLFICQYTISWVLGFEFTSWISYNTLFCFVGSICLFMAFKNIKIYSKVINYWAKPCLAVYLIHMASCVLAVLCNYIGVQHYHGLSWIFLIFTLPIAIYFICAVIEIGRQELMRGIENRIISLFN